MLQTLLSSTHKLDLQKVWFHFRYTCSYIYYGFSFLMSFPDLVEENWASRFVCSIDRVFEATLLAGVLLEEADMSVSPELVTFG
jgi:hypothetical protein